MIPQTTIELFAAALAKDRGWGWATIPEYQRGQFIEQANEIAAVICAAGLVIVPRGVALAGERWLDERAQAIRDMCPGVVIDTEAAFRDEFSGIPFNRDMDHG